MAKAKIVIGLMVLGVCAWTAAGMLASGQWMRAALGLTLDGPRLTAPDLVTWLPYQSPLLRPVPSTEPIEPAPSPPPVAEQPDEQQEETVWVPQRPAAAQDATREFIPPEPVYSDDSDLPKEVTFKATSPDGFDEKDGVYIKNESGLSVSVEKMLEQKLNFTFKAGEKHVLILHTHATESFWPDELYAYAPEKDVRTLDTDYNVVRVGDELSRVLESYGLGVLHDRGVYDYPSYSGAYSRALDAIEEYIRKYPSIQVVIDIHRDSVMIADGSVGKAVSMTEAGKAAQMMFVVGSPGNKLPHDNWKQNLALAAQLQQKLLAGHAGLMRPINLRKERFNQHASPGSMLLEVGTSGNSLSEALTSVQLFGEVAGSFLSGYMT